MNPDSYRYPLIGHFNNFPLIHRATHIVNHFPTGLSPAYPPNDANVSLGKRKKAR